MLKYRLIAFFYWVYNCEFFYGLFCFQLLMIGNAVQESAKGYLVLYHLPPPNLTNNLYSHTRPPLKMYFPLMCSLSHLFLYNFLTSQHGYWFEWGLVVLDMSGLLSTVLGSYSNIFFWLVWS